MIIRKWHKGFIAGIVLAGTLAACTGRGGSGLNTKSGETAEKLMVGVVQMNIRKTLEENRDFIVEGTARVAAEKGRVAVFPERALSGTGGDDTTKVKEAITAIKNAASKSDIYVITGGFTYSQTLKKSRNWMLVVDPEGREVFQYEKLYNHHHATMPGVFFIDSVPCSGIICADRWLRGIEEIPIQMGSKISFELSNNFAVEWVDPLQWYWYVPRAMRNNVWVVFANSGIDNYTWPYTPTDDHGHGHSAVIAPDGSFAARVEDNNETILMADIDVSKASRKEALARSTHPALKDYWEAGMKLQMGQVIKAPSITPFHSEKVDITVAVAQVINDITSIREMVRKAKDENADLIAFPARSVSGEKDLEEVRSMAREEEITVVVGMESRDMAMVWNSAFVIGPDGTVLTRYDQLSADGRFQPGTDAASMWFSIKGVPAIVTIGRDALWTEISELAAVSGAQLHVHLENVPCTSKESDLKRLQVWSTMATFRTFTAVANVCGSTIWEDMHPREEVRAVLDGKQIPDIGSVEIFSPWSANLIVQAKDTSLIKATRKVSDVNPFHPGSTSNFNPKMDTWYHFGAKAIMPQDGLPR